MTKPLHPKASALQQAGLFAGLKSFDELETRIAALPDELARGDAFEAFAEAYLATQRRRDLPQVWPLTAVPTDVLRKLALPLNDYGVDGVAQTVLGGFDVYQVKFRSRRQPLTWRELSTFMGLADSASIHSRVLFTNCDDLPAVMNERKGFFCIRGSDLDRLEEADFRVIENWLAQAQVPTARKQPLPHQHEAMDVLLPALRQHDHVTGIMACGTGKTLVALWIAERMQAQTILVLLPSLALLRQTLHEWLHETSLPSLAYLCVCSDPTVKQDLDAIATPQSKLDFPVKTDPRNVREFLDAPFAGSKIVFSTYQSARVVGEALRKGETFDLGIFDEAHKTAGREGRNYAFALEDSNLPIRKRLFLTATPRHYNPLRKDNEGDAQLVFSMDKPQVYGEQAYRLTFAEAARRGIICNYKVVISVITAGMVTNELLSRGEVLVNGDPIRARQVANQLALTDAIAKYAVNKVFTFHRTVKSAESFVAGGAEGISTHLSGAGRAVLPHRTNQKKWAAQQRSPTDEFQIFHVNGTMPTAQRDKIIGRQGEFRKCDRGIVSNARCLTEGVDVPAVDMVAFLSPRRSRVDIVQATGRAMRRAPGKTTGYVLVPLYLEQAAEESVEEAVKRAEFDEVWDVLQAMQEQDDVLAEIIREMRHERGRTKGFDDARFRERVDILGPRISLEKLRRAITTACIETLADSWEERLGELKAFKKRFGHCNVEHLWPENRKLGHWVANQRKFFAEGKLSETRIQRLNKLGFSWNPTDAFWETNFAELKQFKNDHGHCAVTQKYKTPSGIRLGSWVNTQRQAQKQNHLSADHINRLGKLGFIWNPKDAHWERMFAQLLRFKKKIGHCVVPDKWLENSELASWVATLRQQRRREKLSQVRVERLSSTGFVWDAREGVWDSMLTALINFRKETGSFAVPRRWRPNPRLAAWITRQRRLRKLRKLSPDRILRLDRHGFSWSPHDVAWEGHLAKYLGRRQTQNGLSRKWESHQRTGRKAGNLSAERIRRLTAAGFEWAIKKGPKGPRRAG